jgi:hypothetical protein
MPKIRFRYPETVPASDRLTPGETRLGLDFLETLFTPDDLPRVAGPYTEWKYAPTARDAKEFRYQDKGGVEGLVAYRHQFGGPELIGYDVIGVPLSRSMDVPRQTGQRVGGFFFRSYFRLPDSEERPLPPGMPEVSLIMDEHLVLDGARRAVGRMYVPYDEHGPMGPGTDRPDITQHTLVARQVEHFATTGEQLPLPTARQAFMAAYSNMWFTSPEPPPFMEGLPQR